MASNASSLNNSTYDDVANGNVKRVLIIGAGPGGLLAAINLLRRNNNNSIGAPRYQVTLVDAGVDYGELDESELCKARSWMIGLTTHGLRSIKKIPGLYEDYISKVGVRIESYRIGINHYLDIKCELPEEEKKDFFLVDRNFICAGLARYLNDNFSSSPYFVPYYQTKALCVDVDDGSTKEENNKQRRVVYVKSVAPSNSGAVSGVTPLEYDLLLGCDGVRSVVRNAFITNHRDFSFDISDSFFEFKGIHIPMPTDCKEGCFSLLVNILPNCRSFCLPAIGGMLNITLGWNTNTPCDPELLSKDPTVVAEYLRKNLKYFRGVNFEEMGKLWAGKSVSTVGMTHCNFYHSNKLRAILLGDAAHATNPNIGQGMNTALADAAALNEILDEHEDDWEGKVLPEFSRQRVKEGHALTDLSFHTSCLDPMIQIEIMLRQESRRFFNKIFPSWMVTPEPMYQIGKGEKLSHAYNVLSTKLGGKYLERARRRSQTIMRRHFEEQTGMVQKQQPSSTLFHYSKAIAMVGIVVATGIVVVGKIDTM